VCGAIEGSIESVFGCTIEVGCFQLLLSWVTLSATSLDFVYVPTLIAGVLTVVPVVNPLIVAGPAALYLGCIQGAYVRAALLFIIHFVAYWWVIPDIYQSRITITDDLQVNAHRRTLNSKMRRRRRVRKFVERGDDTRQGGCTGGAVHPYLTALSIVMGIYAFELQGLVLGPLLLCVTLICINVSRKLSALQDGAATETEAAARLDTIGQTPAGGELQSELLRGHCPVGSGSTLKVDVLPDGVPPGPNHVQQVDGRATLQARVSHAA